MTGISNAAIDTLFEQYSSVDEYLFVEYLLNPCFYNNHTSIIERLLKHQYSDEAICSFIEGVNSNYSESPMMDGAYLLFPMKPMVNCLNSKRLMNKIIQTLTDMNDPANRYPLLLNMIKNYEQEHRIITYSILIKLRGMIQFDIDEKYLDGIFKQYNPSDIHDTVNHNVVRIMDWMRLYNLDISLFSYWLNLFYNDKKSIVISSLEIEPFKTSLSIHYPSHHEAYINFENKMKLLNLAIS